MCNTGDANTKICGAAKVDCYLKAQLDFQYNYVNLFKKECNCVEFCTKINYDEKIDRVRLSTNTVGKTRESRRNNFG